MTEGQVTLVISIGGSLLGVVIGFFLNLWNSNRIEKKHRKDEALKNHFQVLKKKVISPLISQLRDLSHYLGELSPGGHGRHWSPDDVYFLLAVPSKDFDIFSLHFEEQSLMLKDLIKKINEHNSKFDDYIESLRERLNSIHPLSKTVLNSSFLYSELIGIVRMTLFQLAGNAFRSTNIKITHDFNEAKIVQEGDCWIVINPSEAVRYARLVSNEDAESCKRRLVELQTSEELQKMALQIFKEADKLKQDVSSTVDVLDSISRQYTELGNIMDRLNECPLCRVIKF